MGRNLGWALTAVISVGLGGLGAASAADMAVKARPVVAPVAAYNWTGCYVGVQGGGVWGRTKHRAEPLFNVDTTPSFDLTGGEVGGTLGCNYQTGSWVFGVEGDGSWTNASGSSNEILPGNPIIIGHTDMRWLATVRGRIGYAFNNNLIYATGGWAGGGVNIGVDARSRAREFENHCDRPEPRLSGRRAAFGRFHISADSASLRLLKRTADRHGYAPLQRWVPAFGFRGQVVSIDLDQQFVHGNHPTA